MSVVRARWTIFMTAPAIDTKVANQVVVVYFFQWNRPCIDKFGFVDLANMRCGRSEDASGPTSRSMPAACFLRVNLVPMAAG